MLTTTLITTLRIYFTVGFRTDRVFVNFMYILCYLDSFCDAGTSVWILRNVYCFIPSEWEVKE